MEKKPTSQLIKEAINVLEQLDFIVTKAILVMECKTRSSN
jgi:hypothetical protein